MLGVTITYGPQQETIQIKQLMKKVEEVSDIWIHRNASLTAKVMLINTLMSLIFTYYFAVLPLLTQDDEKRFYEIITKFLWKGSKAKIPMSVLQNPIDVGGLKLVNIEIKQISGLMAWLGKLNKDESKWDYVYDWITPEIKEKIWDCNMNLEDVKKLIKHESFWKSLVIAWSKIHFFEPRSTKEIKNEIIWNNSHIRIGNNPIQPKKNLVENGLLRVQDLLMEDDQIKNFDILKREFLVEDWMFYSQLIAALKKKWGNSIKNNVEEDGTNKMNWVKIVENTKPSRWVYNFLIEQEAVSIKKYLHQWERELLVNIEMDEYLQAFRNSKITTDVIKLRDFQYRLLLHKIFTNDTLHKWGKVNAPECEICNRGVRQTLHHLILECENSRKIWNDLKEEFKIVNCTWSDVNIILNVVHPKMKHILNFLVLVAKQFLFRQKCLQSAVTSQLIFQEYVFYIKRDCSNAIVHNKQKRFLKKWKPVFHKFQTILERM